MHANEGLKRPPGSESLAKLQDKWIDWSYWEELNTVHRSLFWGISAVYFALLCVLGGIICTNVSEDKGCLQPWNHMVEKTTSSDDGGGVSSRTGKWKLPIQKQCRNNGFWNICVSWCSVTSRFDLYWHFPGLLKKTHHRRCWNVESLWENCWITARNQ